MRTIDEVFLFVTEGTEGEGLIGQRMGDSWIPFVCADRARLESLRPLAEEIAKATKKKVKLIRYSAREEIETLG